MAVDNQNYTWMLDKRSMFVGAIVGAVVAWVLGTSWMASLISKNPSDVLYSTTELQTYGLRKAAHFLHISSPATADEDVTRDMIVSLAYRHISDDRLTAAMSQLFVNDGFPKEDIQPKLMRKNGGEVRVVRKGGEYFVELHGARDSECDGIKYAICK